VVQFPCPAVEVVRGQQPHGDDLDVGLAAPAKQVGDLAGAHPVAFTHISEPGFSGPPTVTVQHDADVSRPLRADQLPCQERLVAAVDEFLHQGAGTHVQRAYAGAGTPRIGAHAATRPRSIRQTGGSEQRANVDPMA